MKKEQVLDLMSAVPPDLVEEADLQAPAKRHLPRAVRTGLIAACLCLALLGTAAAAQRLSIQILEEDDRGITWISGGITYYPVDSLSEEVLALDDPHYAAKSFDSWDQMEEFIGSDLMDNPVLDASPTKSYGIRWKNGNAIRGCFLAVGGGGLTSIFTLGCYQVGEANIKIQGFLFTDRMEEVCGEDWDQRFRGYTFSNYEKVGIESYTSPNGLTAQILTFDRRTFPYCSAVFSLKGVPFIVDANSNSLDEAHAALIQVLDGFILSE